MDFEKLEEEILAVQEALSNEAPGSDEHEKLEKQLERLAKLRYDLYEQAADVEIRTRQQDLAETESKAKLAIEQQKVENSEKESKRGFKKVVVQGGLMLVALCATLFEEDVKPMTSKAFQNAKSFIGK